MVRRLWMWVRALARRDLVEREMQEEMRQDNPAASLRSDTSPRRATRDRSPGPPTQGS